MGTWASNIFDNDEAADVRDSWREGILDGTEPGEITRNLVREHEASKEEKTDDAKFWISLAAAQLETGRLNPEIRDKALLSIAAGGDLADRDDEGQDRKRHALALLKLAEILQGPNVTPRRIHRPHGYGVSFEVGDVIRLYGRKEGTDGLVVVVNKTPGAVKGTVDPVIEFLLWDGKILPSANDFALLPTVYSEKTEYLGDIKKGIKPFLLVVMTAKKHDCFCHEFGKVVAHGVRRTPLADYSRGELMTGYGNQLEASWSSWPNIAAYLKNDRYLADLALSKEVASIPKSS